MEKNESESKEGFYNVFNTEDGQKLIVIRRLDEDQPIELYPMQQALLPYVDGIIVFYWIFYVCIAIYLVGINIAMPLLKKFKR